MGASVNLFLLAVWCSVLLNKSVHSQGFFYRHKDVNQYEIKNGKYRLIPTTTPPPSILETFFPWAGNAYNSVRTPEEDAAILNSISDPAPAASNNAPSTTNQNDGLMSWFSVPGFGSSSSSAPSNEPPPMILSPQRPNILPPPMNFNNHMQMPMFGAASQNEPVVVPPPGAENQLGMLPPQLPPSTGQTQSLPTSQYPEYSQTLPISQYPEYSQPLSPSQYPEYSQTLSASQYPEYSQTLSTSQYPEYPQAVPPSQYPEYPQSYSSIPNEINNNHNPTFQFHQQVKDSIPIPSPTLPGLSQGMFPYPYASGGNFDFSKITATATEKSPSFLDVIANYFTFGKRSDLDEELHTQEEPMMEARSMDSETEYEAGEDDYPDTNSNAALKEATPTGDSSAAASPSAAAPSADKPYLCPKSGIWRWNGEVCIAVGPVPVWACKPNDLIVSGKIAICRNKIYFSPKVISNGQRVNP